VTITTVLNFDTTDQFKLEALQASAVRMYAQPSALAMYQEGKLDAITLRRTPAFPFLLPVDVVP
jgi:hypothetical protein